jgi:hypothetical protein
MAFHRTLLLALAVSSAAAGAYANPIVLHNTGVDAVSTPLADTTGPDLHYKVSYGTAIGSYTTTSASAFAVNDNTQFPMNAYWIQSDSQSAWISPFGRNTTDASANGFYDYQTTFSLTGLVAGTAMISGQWAADNCGLDILINGHSTGQAMSCSGPSNYAPFGGWTSFAITSNFTAGLNTIDFLVENYAQNGGNPTGLRVEMSGTASASSSNPPIPEPLTLALFGSGIAGLALLRRRKRAG